MCYKGYHVPTKMSPTYLTVWVVTYTKIIILEKWECNTIHSRDFIPFPYQVLLNAYILFGLYVYKFNK